MRTITVERRKRLIGALAKFCVYAEDHERFDRMIGDVPCRSVGLLKNGGSVLFRAGDGETRVFVKSSATRNSVEMMRIPAGQSDVTLPGQIIGFGGGLAFWFDGNDSEEAQEQRKASAQNGWRAFVLSIIMTAVLIVAAFSLRYGVKNCNKRASNKIFTVQEMTIKLNNTFRKESLVDGAAFFSSPDAGISFSRITKDDEKLTNVNTLDAYAAYIISENEDIDEFGELMHEDEMTYVEYTDADNVSGDTIKGYVAFYESRDAYWFVEFYSLEKDYKKMRPSFVTWAKSVIFND